MKTILTRACSVLIVLGVSACGSSDWESAQQADTVEALEAFVQSNPTSEFVGVAESRIEELVWVDATLGDASEGYKEYLSRYSAGAHSEEARSQLSELRWLEAVAANTIEGFTDFLRSGATGDQVGAARDAVIALQSDASADRPAVEMTGMFSGGIVRYVDSVSARYHGNIAGMPADVAYVVSAATNAEGQQTYFKFQDGDSVVSVRTGANVSGTIELQTPDGATARYELIGLVKAADDDLIGSYLVGRGPDTLKSNVDGLMIEGLTDGTPEAGMSGSNAVLFAVHDNFRLLYVP